MRKGNILIRELRKKQVDRDGEHRCELMPKGASRGQKTEGRKAKRNKIKPKITKYYKRINTKHIIRKERILISKNNRTDNNERILNNKIPRQQKNMITNLLLTKKHIIKIKKKPLMLATCRSYPPPPTVPSVLTLDPPFAT